MINKKRSARLKKATKKIDPKAWMGYEHITNSAQFIQNEAKRIFTVASPSDVDEREGYTEIVGKLGLTAKALQKKQNTFLGMTIFFIVLMLVVLGYTFYQFMASHYNAILPSFVLSILCLAIAFRYHFWYFQMKVEKLGCTLQEWLDYVLSGKKP